MKTSSPRYPRVLVAYTLPFAIFMAGLVLSQGVAYFAGPGAPLLLAKPMYWVFPLQTILCGFTLFYFWREYEFGPWSGLPLAILVGVLALGIWISPQSLFGFDQRRDGFDPGSFAHLPVLYWASLSLRFLRLVIVVPLLEEIFWRGFLMRYMIREDFSRVAFGTFTVFSFGAVALCFALAHSGADFIPALLTGFLYNFVAIRTKSLTCCIVAHGVTNLGLGIYIMATGQWGFW